MPPSRPINYVALIVVAVTLVLVYKRSHERRLHRMADSVKEPTSLSGASNIEESAPIVKEESTDCPPSEVFQRLFCPMGFRSAKGKGHEPNPLYALERPDKSCTVVFDEWLAENAAQPDNQPPEKPPEELMSDYNLQGLARMVFAYYGDDAKNADNTQVNVITQEEMNGMIEAVENGQVATICPYVYEGIAMGVAMEEYPPGERGMTIGTLIFWVEAIAFRNGAKEVIVAEYQPINSTVQGLKWVHPVEVGRNWDSYTGLDWVASYSSLEHSGLGRYGDILSPLGDVKFELLWTDCPLNVVKEKWKLEVVGGNAPKCGVFSSRVDCFTWGCPLARRTLLSTMHIGSATTIFPSLFFHIGESMMFQIYSTLRWSLMGAGFKLLDFFYLENKTDFSAFLDFPDPTAVRQPVAVFQKIG